MPMDEASRRLLDRGREHYAAGEYDKAGRCLAQVLRNRHAFADVYHMLGVIYAHRGLAKRAQGMYEAALKLNPAYTEAAMNLAVSLNEEGRFDEAREVHRRMLSARRPPGAGGATPADAFIRGKLANKHAELAAIYEQAGLGADAIRELERALTLCPGFVDLRTRLGGAYRATGDLKAATREYERAKKDNPRLPDPRLQLGMTHYAAGEHEKAAREWREVIALEPSNRFAKLYLGLVEPRGARAAERGADRPARRSRA